MRMVKKLLGAALVTATTTLTRCVTQDLYNKFAHSEDERAEIKKKMSKIVPFKKSN